MRRAAPNRDRGCVPTLNLAQSLAIALSNLFPLEESPRRRRETSPPEDETAPTKDVRRLLSSLKETLSSAGYPGRGHSKEVIAEIESFVKRGKPTAREVTLLLGALAAVRRRLLPALAAFALALPAAAAVPDVTITGVAVSPASSADQPCPVTLTFRASVLLDMRASSRTSGRSRRRGRQEPARADWPTASRRPDPKWTWANRRSPATDGWLYGPLRGDLLTRRSSRSTAVRRRAP